MQHRKHVLEYHFVKDRERHVIYQPILGQIDVELGGRKGPEPTRYGDWEKSGRCIDF